MGGGATTVRGQPTGVTVTADERGSRRLPPQGALVNPITSTADGGDRPSKAFTTWGDFGGLACVEAVLMPRKCWHAYGGPFEAYQSNIWNR